MRLAWPFIGTPAAAVCALLPAFGASATQTLNAALGALGKLSVVQSSISLTHAGSTFADFTGGVTLQYKIRTNISGGSSTLTLKATSDFTPANGPSLANS